MIGLEVFWYIVFVASVICYAMLDGFDLGVGMLLPLVKKDEERRVFLNAIGPVWDGNEVWLVVVIGGMFAGFPKAYATLFSAFYMPLILLICALIFRAVAIEFRSKMPSKIWRFTWDYLFALASFGIALAVGMALGNLIQGIPLDKDNNYTGNILSTFFQPYPVIVGVLTVSLFMMHGALYLVMKTEGELHDRLKSWVQPTIIFFILSYVIVTMVTLIYQSHMVEKIRSMPYLFVLVLANVLVIANIPREISKEKAGFAFISSCLNIALLMALFAVGNFPNLIRSTTDPQSFSLDIYNASASTTTLVALTIIVGIGIPLVIAYGFYIYHTFKGKVKISHMSY